MDPPRAGSTEEFLTAVKTLAPKKLVYVSCNPVTLSRDLEFITQNGYEVKKIQPVDMFPFTDHCETVVLLVRKENKTFDANELTFDNFIVGDSNKFAHAACRAIAADAEHSYNPLLFA